jgi:predicted PolB exonuclease-like 3'-5' exonuclease
MANQQHIQPDHILVLDIETVPQFVSFEELPELWKVLWADKISKTMPENFSPAEMYEERAGIQAEFGKIICISTGYFYTDKGGRLCFRLKSYAGNDEKQLLAEFINAVDKFCKTNPAMHFAGHNIKEFDIPYISRRILINGLTLPSFLQLSGKKPWETNLVDTMQLWKFGDYKNYTSLNLLANCLGIQTPKEGIDGSMVKDIYYKQKDLPRIVDYCQKDVVATAQVFLRLQQLPLLPKENIFIAE